MPRKNNISSISNNNIKNAIRGARKAEEYKHFLLLYKKCRLWVVYYMYSHSDHEYVKVFLNEKAAKKWMRREAKEKKIIILLLYREAEFISE